MMKIAAEVQAASRKVRVLRPKSLVVPTAIRHLVYTVAHLILQGVTS